MPRPAVDFNLYLITDRKQTKMPLLNAVEQALRGGVRAVQLREKDLSSRELFELAQDMRKLTAHYGAKLFINDRIDIALGVDADGIHLGGDSIPLYKARNLVGEEQLIGVSCHNQVSARTAQEKGADFITFGPVYFTPSKAKYGEPLGTDKLELVAESLTIPVFALGGISTNNIHDVMNAGVHGISLISAILAEEDPRSAAASLIARLGELQPGHDRP